jgi:hypothetical protein
MDQMICKNSYDKRPDEQVESEEDDPLPVILVGPDLADVVDESVAALARRAVRLGVFQRAHRLVHVTAITPEEAAASPVVVSLTALRRARRALVAGTPVIHTMEVATLREELTRVARFRRFDERRKKPKRCLPSDAVVKAVHARKKWPGVPHLVGVTETPFMRCDGSICQTPGYDHATGWLYAPSRKFPLIDERPTQREACRAWRIVEEVFIDFPFNPVEHISVPIAATLTELLRPAIEGCTPAFVFDGNHRGVGKSLLTDAVANITTGRDMPRRSYPRSEEEMEKVIGAYALQGARHLSLDNVTGDFGGPTLDAVLSTPGEWEPRILGRSEVPSVQWGAVVYVTGHHLSFGEESDTCDRVLKAYLHTELENPRTRTDFRHPDLRAWIKRHQGRLVWALLTMARAWDVAGRPAQKGCPNWGTFEDWAAIVPHIIVFAGGPSPMVARVRDEAAVSDTQRAMACILETWPKLQRRVEENELDDWEQAVKDAKRNGRSTPRRPQERTGLMTIELRRALYGDDDHQGGAARSAEFDAMREALETICCPRQRAGRAEPTTHAISKKLEKRKNTNIGGQRLRNELDSHTKVAIWWVEKVQP